MGRLTQIWQSSLLCCTVAAILSSNAAPLRAQSSGVGNDLNGTQELNDIFNNSSDQGASSLFGLLNKIQLLNGRSSSEFAADQQEGFQSAVADFHKKQKEKLGAPVMVPQKTTVPALGAPTSKP